MEPNTVPTERLRYGKGLALLSLDGGGIRGLSSLYVLQRLMEQLDPENPPRPCDCFDLIGGTSTGGLIALMLGRLRMTVAECIDAYHELMPAIFEKAKHRYSISKGKLQGRYDGKAIEEGVKRILEERNIRPDELLKDPGSTCKTFVCIWEAARATSAATTFFEPIKILHEEFVDGAFGANNPIDEVWTEAGDIWTRNTGETLEDNISCFVSIGTGIPAFGKVDESLVGMVQTLKAIATNCESAAERFQRHHPALDGRFFRFNVPRGLENIGLEEINKAGDLIAATRQYLESQSAFLDIEKFQSAFQQRQRTYPTEQRESGLSS
ncbi:uncharacterized protein J4E92_009948 [Alternaria infectoria]|uniref:uncharacterized protein n=1 Tax=Alternaria infectoria TaxID=45303 RepID=UPI002220A121|nr:uncharacterized protein J4E92_009948 [Alternaria infectoria]KAI4913076.1 hypothetical protein J4E92_009948 [Alternaria infectoria]